MVPTKYSEGININTYTDKDASIVITDELNEDDAAETNCIKTEIPSTSMDADFFMDSLILVMNMDYSVDGNEWNLLSFEPS